MTPFININVVMDFCIRTSHDQILTYARFIIEAPGVDYLLFVTPIFDLKVNW